MPAVSLLWNTNVAVMTCENNFPLRVGVAACGGSHSEGWQGYALLSAASLDSTSLMGTSTPPPPPPPPYSSMLMSLMFWSPLKVKGSTS